MNGRPRERQRESCLVAGCEYAWHNRGLCERHWYAWQRAVKAGKEAQLGYVPLPPGFRSPNGERRAKVQAPEPNVRIEETEVVLLRRRVAELEKLLEWSLGIPTQLLELDFQLA